MTPLILLLLSADRPPVPAGAALRSPTVAVNGMVATSHPLAAQVGLDILKAGGNAVDAAVATSAAMGLMEPTSCGIGGDLFAIVWDAKTQKLYGLNGCGRAPLKATREHFAKLGLTEIPNKGPLSWSVPGCVCGWDQLLRRFGTKLFADVLAPSVRYAEEGVAVPEVIAGYWRASERLLGGDPGSRATFLPGGRAPRAGQVFRNPELAATYRAVAAGGRDAFYTGDTAAKLVAFSEKVGGLFSKADFDKHSSEWVEPVSVPYRGYEVWELPPPGQGIAALQMLRLLEPFDLKAWGPNSPDYWHTLIEAKKLAYADRAKYYADPLFGKVPVQRLISADYAAERRKRIDPAKTMPDPPAGDAKVGQSDTIYLCVVDKDRNCVSLIQSNYGGFGSGLSAPGTGFGIQNRGCLFCLDPAHANTLEPGKRPFHTIIPGMLTRGGKAVMPFGVMGGDMQPQGHVQVLVNLLDFGMNQQSAGDAPRVEHVGGVGPTGAYAGPGVVQAEPGIPAAVIAELEKRGHMVKRVRVNGGGYQAIRIVDGVLHGGTESRKDGAAVGY